MVETGEGYAGSFESGFGVAEKVSERVVGVFVAGDDPRHRVDDNQLGAVLVDESLKGGSSINW